MVFEVVSRKSVSFVSAVFSRLSSSHPKKVAIVFNVCLC